MLAITNGRLLTITLGIIEEGTILIDGGRFLAVGQDLDVPQGARVIDAAGCHVYPGLVDAHTHHGVYAEISGPEGADGNEMTDPITPHVRALDSLDWYDPGFDNSVANGVTTVNVLPGSGNVIGGQGVAVKTWGARPSERVLLQPSGVKMALGENPKRVYGGKKKTPATRLGNAAKMREAFVQARTYRQKRGRDEGERDLRWEILADVLEGKLPARCHAHRADDILTALRISREFGFRLTIEHCTEGYYVAGELAAAGVMCTLGPLLTGKSKQELKDRSLEAAPALERAGVVFGFTTDHPVIPSYSLPLCAAYAVGAGMSREGALRALTLDPARVIGLEHRIGSLDAGKDADCLIADGDILDPRTRVLTTIVDGQVAWTMQDGPRI
ncbi:MAG: amidohydrolase family protein [Anaerolineae bacterium]|nr:amidohydrolase family protein [Anaerolineae bacterium]